MINPEIINLRKELHRNPELSSFEYGTAKRIRRFIEKHNPTDILENIGGTGLVGQYYIAFFYSFEFSIFFKSSTKSVQTIGLSSSHPFQ